jgi:glycogen phosphorylase
MTTPKNPSKGIPLQPARYLHSDDENLRWLGATPVRSANLSATSTIIEDDRSGMSVEALRRAFTDHLYYTQGVNAELASIHDIYLALSHTVRDRLMNRWIRSIEEFFQNKNKAVFYLSAEYLMGRQLGSNLLNTKLFQKTKTMLKSLGIDLYTIMEQEPDPGLGNGGLGRLAACFLDSLATLDIPALGYGIRYEFGIFKQEFFDGWQTEKPDAWLRLGNPWEIQRVQLKFPVRFGGHTSVASTPDITGNYRSVWNPETFVVGTPYDTLVPGFGTDTVNTLRLWSARADSDFDFEQFNAGEFARAVAEKTASESISKVLYPNDNNPEGRELRLKQQYFFVSCSLQDSLRIFLLKNKDLRKFHEKAAIQLNDTHPAVAVAELMRLLIDEHGLPWEAAWEVTVNTFGYTNHTLMPEALEKWPVSLFGRLLPRILEISYEINHRFLQEIKVKFPADEDRISRMSLFEEGEDKHIRMAHLASVGSHAINGVAELHSELLQTQLLKDFHDLWPKRFSNVTNGITPRRWIMLSNLNLTALISGQIGTEWITDLRKLSALEKYASDTNFQEQWSRCRQDNKKYLAHLVEHQLDIKVDPTSLYDVLVKRLHEYKRQLLLCLYIITLYHRLKSSPQLTIVPRTFIFAGKAAPGYTTAKLIIKLINSVSDVIKRDPSVSKFINVVFLPNFSVSLGERIYPAADLSEQISLAGKEASGTGNMKFALNGALTIGTLDGANVEIRNSVGPENFFLFGMNVNEVKELKYCGYNPASVVSKNKELACTLQSLISGLFSRGDTKLFRPLYDSLLSNDHYCLLADFASYLEAQDKVSLAYEDRKTWAEKSILNTARVGYFSSDRSVKEYCGNIWGVKPMIISDKNNVTGQEKDLSCTIEDQFFAKKWGNITE